KNSTRASSVVASLTFFRTFSSPGPPCATGGESSSSEVEVVVDGVGVGSIHGFLAKAAFCLKTTCFVTGAGIADSARAIVIGATSMFGLLRWEQGSPDCRCYDRRSTGGSGGEKTEASSILPILTALFPALLAASACEWSRPANKQRDGP